MKDLAPDPGLAASLGNVQKLRLGDWEASFDQDLFDQLRQQRGVRWGRPVRFHVTADSSNDLALAEVDSEAKTGIVHVVHEQSAGRGRRGNSWTSPPGRSLAFSTLVRIPDGAIDVTRLSLAVGLAVRDVAARRLSGSCGENPPRATVKWPNDTYVDEKKVAGVLIETRRSRGGAWAVVIGVGLNALATSFPAELPNAGSLEDFGASDLARESLLADCLRAIESRVSQFLTQGVGRIVTDLRAHDYLKRRAIEVDGLRCRGDGIGAGGELLVSDEAGIQHRIVSGHVELAPPSSA